MVIIMPLMAWLVMVSTAFCYGQKENPVVNGTVVNYPNQALYLYQCGVYPDKGGSDTLLLLDSTFTDKNEEFAFSDKAFSKTQNFGKNNEGLYKIVLQRNQFFYILYDGHSIEIKTFYQPNTFYNIATDSLVVIKSDENKRFNEFQHLQQQINIANYWLLQMMRLYPLPDPFHKQIEDEYFSRYKAMEQFVKKTSKEHTPAGLIAKAYYQPILPDWKQPDPWRDSITALHYFDYFNPAEPFYLHTNILPEKLERWLSLPLNNTPTSLETLQQKEEKIQRAADEWMQKAKSNQETFEWSLNYLFKILEKQKQYDAMYYLYDKYVQNKSSDCESPVAYKLLREKMSVLKNIQIGSTAPDFVIMEGKLNLYQLPSDYTLLLFWATWCPHCLEEVPKIRDAVKQINGELSKKGEKIMVAAVSLDTDKEQWQQFVNEKKLLSFINFSELKGWKSESVKRFNVYATPTMFLLDKNKKIIAKPETAEELIKSLSEH
ncbi:MAG: hypothetical protein A3F72_09815 [Bacteroidetes bacterium RIFCSPLOWO2_12_FULL_35_15]|nr:MAG: hypothetical protein A3F72_09815 [Bacteroidetes bacterium RIFCSPLOWO2_12_FULL_35_15]